MMRHGSMRTDFALRNVGRTKNSTLTQTAGCNPVRVTEKYS